MTAGAETRHTPVTGPLGSLRSRVLSTAMALTAVAAPLVAVFIFARAANEGRVNGRLIAMSAFTLCFPALYLFRSRMRFGSAGYTYLALVWLMSVMVAVRGGATAGTAGMQLVVVVLAGLLFGTRGVWIAVSANIIGYACAGGLVIGGVVPPVVQSMWDPNHAAVWVRSTFILALFGGAAALAVTYTTARLEQEAERARTALAREQAQREALAEAEREKAAARDALAEAQRVEALGRMAGGVAHDFNNLLTVIMGACEVARLERDIPGPVDLAMGDIMNAALQGAELTRGLLVLGRRDLGRTAIVDVAALVRRLAGPIRRLLPSDVSLDIDAAEPLHVHIDPTQLERVMLNLVANARDAVAGNGLVTLACQRRTLAAGEAGLAGGDHVAVTVRDTGSGMDEQTRARIFEPFFTTKAHGHGTGIGMALVQGFVSEASGAVLVESAPDQGTTVTLILPETTPTSDQLATPASPVSGSHAPAAMGGCTILVVEDTPSVLTYTTRILRAAGYRVLEAADGDRALDCLRDRSRPIDLLCIDGVIPGAGTAEVIAEARRLRPTCGIVLCTGYVDVELLRRGIRLGELACVRKPYTSEALLTTIAQTLPNGRTPKTQRLTSEA